MKNSRLWPVGVRWTIGDVSDEGFEALRLSVWGAWKAFGPEATYAVCYNSIPLARAQELTGELPPRIHWLDSTGQFPAWLLPYLEAGKAEGVGWKFAPLRIFPDRYEIALDNDCILWQTPAAVENALSITGSCVIAADVQAHFGQFASLCGSEPRNSGIRGTPPGFDLEGVLRATLERQGCVLRSETDEQGLQVATLKAHGALVVDTADVSICSPFPPHVPSPGRCGAHFVGLNARNLPWQYYGRLASLVRREHWRNQRGALYERVGVKPQQFM